MRFVSFMIATLVAGSGAQNIGPGPYCTDAILALFGVSVRKRQSTNLSQCMTICHPLANNTNSSDCPISVCCASTFIHTYRNCVECVSEVVDGSNSTSVSKAAVDQLLTLCIQSGALPSPPPASQGHTNHASYAEALSSQTVPHPSLTKAPPTGTAVVPVPPVISPTSSFSNTHTSSTSVGVTPSSTNSAVRTTLGQAYSSTFSVLVWAILQM